ncbi:MAG: HD domain-containing protein, partial [Lachnospiraceae bacterium]|nr:HD domain-containing protein [Lachnospiraceae bacterium]
DPEKEGWIYLGTDKSNIIHGNMTGGMKNYEVRTYPEQNNINAIGFAEGILWICSDDGIGNVDENGRYTKLQNVKMNNSVDDMMEDIEGNVWFVSSRQGVLKITSSIFTDINRLADLPAFVANTTCVYKNDLYIGTDSGLIVLQNKEKSIETPLTEMLADSRIRSIKEDSRGDLWICSYSDSGLICLHSDGTIDTYSTDNGLASNRVRTISEAEDGTMMVSVSGGVYAIKDGEIERSYGSEDGLNNLEILTICPGESGKIYLGSDGDGIYVLEDEKVSRLGLDDGLQSEVILRIKKDPEKEGLYWIITSNSIGYMQDDKITTINEFPYSNNFDICFGNDGYAWILSSGGIYVVNKEDLLENGEIAYTLYDGETGLPYVTTANSRNYVSETGDLYVCGTTGVSEVNIFGDSVSDAQARLVVPYLEADDDIITIEPDTKSITIPASTKRLVIHGYALTYTLGNPTVGYKLQGFDDEMRYTTRRNMRPVTYTNLDGGNYRFMMETVDTATGEVQNEFELSIVKQKALYEMWWFRILVASLIAVAVIIIVRIYIRRKTERLEKEKAEKQEVVDETISVFAQCIDMKDNYTRGHSFRVSKYTGLLAERLGYDDEQVHEMKNIALLHDIGKISIPDEILNKQSGLTDEEYEIMKSHASNGYEVLKNVKIMPNLADGAGYHHERLDGKGYPYGKKGDEIPMVAQIIAVADTFDAMYSSRPYRKKMPLREVVSEIERVSGTQLNRDVVKCLVELAEEGLLEDETAV